MTDMDESKMTFEELLNRDGRLVYTNVGVSMMPLIREGKDVLIIEKCDAEKLKKYDVVLFKRENIKGRGKYVLHRILKVLPEGKYWIVGDNCTDGEIVERNMILGVLSGITRGKNVANLSGIKYRLYVRLWCAPYHLRFLFLKAKSFIKYAVRAVAYKLRIKK